MEELAIKGHRVTITSVRFTNFKAFANFSVSLQHMNMLVGPNNAGKSTIIGAFRVLSAALARARTKKAERLPGQQKSGWTVAEEAIPISLENVHTNYAEVDSSVVFHLSNGRELTLLFPREGGCFLIPDDSGKRIVGISDFRREFPISIGFVPVLGPVEHEEELVQEATVRRGLATHRASRHFRSYWHHNPEDFPAFREQVQSTWPGLDIQTPELAGPGDRRLVMFCAEERIARELYWAGSGFQVWCQILTYLVRSRDATLIVIDEPEIYLHPNLQRQLATILREAGPDILLATHSTDIVADSDPQDLLIVDKGRRSARRMNNPAAISIALEALGSVHNAAITHLTRTRRVLFVEGNDLQLLDRFGRRLNVRGLSSNQQFASLPLGGFPSNERVKAVCLGIEKSLGLTCLFSAVFDSDYRCEEEIEQIHEELRALGVVTYIHNRKEIENYLLIPTCLDRAVNSVISDRTNRGGQPIVFTESSSVILSSITEAMKFDTFSQYQSNRLAVLRHTGRDSSSILSETTSRLEERWTNLDTRLRIVPGKRVFRQFASYIADNYGITVTSRHVIDSMTRQDIPEDLRRIIHGLDEFRNRDPGGHQED